MGKVSDSLVIQPNMFHGDICFKSKILSLLLSEMRN